MLDGLNEIEQAGTAALIAPAFVEILGEPARAFDADDIGLGESGFVHFREQFFRTVEDRGGEVFGDARLIAVLAFGEVASEDRPERVVIDKAIDEGVEQRGITRDDGCE